MTNPITIYSLAPTAFLSYYTYLLYWKTVPMLWIPKQSTRPFYMHIPQPMYIAEHPVRVIQFRFSEYACHFCS